MICENRKKIEEATLQSFEERRAIMAQSRLSSQKPSFEQREASNRKAPVDSLENVTEGIV